MQISALGIKFNYNVYPTLCEKDLLASVMEFQIKIRPKIDDCKKARQREMKTHIAGAVLEGWNSKSILFMAQ